MPFAATSTVLASCLPWVAIRSLSQAGREATGWTKGPIRKLRYEVINNCPIFDYTRDGLMELFAAFTNLEIRPGKSGFLLRATK